MIIKVAEVMMFFTDSGESRLESKVSIMVKAPSTSKGAYSTIALTRVMMSSTARGITTGKSEIKESIAEMLEVEAKDLPNNKEALKNRLNEWLEGNPDGEDDDDFYKGVE